MIREEIVQGLLKGMQRLPVLVPPMLEGAFGYNGQSRFVAFYWTAEGHEMQWDDGDRTSLANWMNWLSYSEHPYLLASLQELYTQGVHFGAAGTIATHYFLLDRERRQVYAGKLLDVLRLLAIQHTQKQISLESRAIDPAPDVLPLRDQTLSELLAALDKPESQDTPASQIRELERRVREQQRLEREMVQWLDTQARQYPDEERTTRTDDADPQEEGL